jgi:hypothetical protein
LPAPRGEWSVDVGKRREPFVYGAGKRDRICYGELAILTLLAEAIVATVITDTRLERL